MEIYRYPMHIARYKMILHKKAAVSGRNQEAIKNSVERRAKDGLNSLSYKVIQTTKLQLYTRLLVTFNQTEILSSDACAA